MNYKDQIFIKYSNVIGKLNNLQKGISKINMAILFAEILEKIEVEEYENVDKYKKYLNRYFDEMEIIIEQDYEGAEKFLRLNLLYLNPIIRFSSNYGYSIKKKFYSPLIIGIVVDTILYFLGITKPFLPYATIIVLILWRVSIYFKRRNGKLIEFDDY